MYHIKNRFLSILGASVREVWPQLEIRELRNVYAALAAHVIARNKRYSRLRKRLKTNLYGMWKLVHKQKKITEKTIV